MLQMARNAATQQLMKVLVDETFARFPGCDGWIVRTGETYTYDTPFHFGNSPKGVSLRAICRCLSFLGRF